MDRPRSSGRSAKAIGRVIGKYTLHAPIAAGGMATVHLGKILDAATASDIVAIKRLHTPLASDPEFVAMFLDEARLTAQIDHQNVARTLDIVSIPPEIFIVMEYVVGDSLSRLTRSHTPPPFQVITRVIADALHGLHAAHEATDRAGRLLDVVHRDVSPQNILVNTDGIAKLIDFGVAKAVGRLQSTRQGEVKGKLAYMAPEQLRGRPVTRRADIYSAGVVLWEFLTGKRLFKGDDDGAIATRIIEGDIPRPKEIWAKQAQPTLAMVGSAELDALDAITMRALSLDLNRRYATALEMARELEAALAPASRREVGTWVSAAARDLLASRAESIAEIRQLEVEIVIGDDDEGDEPPPTHRPDALLPIIVADLVATDARDFLTTIADSRGTVLVPLLAAPSDGGEHVLEVHVPGEDDPSFFYARPMGPPQEAGFPLALRPFRPLAEEPTARKNHESPTGQVEARTFTRQPLSAEHTRDLLSARHAAPIEANVLGRTIAKGQLEIEARIGSGGGGSVYLARHRELRTAVVAVKVLHDSAQRDIAFCERFHAEARAASRLDHPNLVRVIDFGQEPDGLLYLTMDLLDGVSVRDLINRDKRVPLERAVEIMLQICAGLAHAHSHDIVHRDIKPSNVMLVSKKDDDGRPIEVVKVCDFGIALQRVAGGFDPSAARVAGTPQYMSPEQCRDGAEIDGRSDIYSCGVMLYELVTGELPFQGQNDAHFLQLHLAAAPTPPSTHLPDIDPLLEQVILKMLAKHPENRHASMREVRNALKELLTPAFVPDVAPREETPEPSAVASSLASEIMRDPMTRMTMIALLRARPKELIKEVEKLEAAVHILAAQGEVAALGVVVRVMSAMLDESTHAPSPAATEAAACARRLLHTIADPITITPLAEQLLTSPTAPRVEELSLFAWAPSEGALALYNARSKTDSPSARTRFVSTMRLLGAPAAPVICAALQHLLPRADAPVENPPLAADLLHCVPAVHDEAMGAVVARYVRAQEQELVRSAITVLVHVWGERAKPLVLASLQSRDDAIRFTALRALTALGGVDEFVLRKIDSITTGSSNDDLLITAAEALTHAVASSRPAATRIVLHALRRGDTRAAVVIAFARAALALSSDEARPEIEKRSTKSNEPLRGQLRALL